MTANVMAQVPSYVPTNGLVGWWPFNGNANDESGNGNNGTVNGATLTTDRFGNAGKAYSFDGVNDYIDFGDLPSYDFSNLSFTISLWVSRIQFNNLNNYDNSFVIGKWDHGGATAGQNEFTIVFNHSPSPLNTVGFYIESGTNIQGISTNSTITNNLWNNITVKRNSNLIFIYLNGQLSQTGTIGNIAINNVGRSLLLASYFPNNPAHITSWNFNNAQFDDIAIWNRALSECEISDLYNAQLGSFSNTTVSVNLASNVIGSNATLTVSTPIQSLQWQSNPSNIGWVNLSDNSNYNGVNNDTLVVSNLQLSNHNQPFRVLACGDTSNIATIQIADTCITNVTIYDTLLTTVTDTLIINTTLSLPAPNNENTILIYPNPASDHITIDNGNFAAMAGYSIKITNNAGQQVFQNAINQQQFYVDLSTWSGNGLYFVHLIDPQNNTVTVRKIVLQ
ncbi:MAG: hypothetical protein RL264_2970 [Bacteroidota bacterium]